MQFRSLPVDSCRLIIKRLKKCTKLKPSSISIKHQIIQCKTLFHFPIRCLSSAVPKSKKIFPDAATALTCAGLVDGQTLLVGGFGLCGIPQALINEIKNRGTKDLTIVSNNCGIDDWGLGVLLHNHQIKRMISSYVGENLAFEKQYLSGELEVELIPQGTLAERLRAAGSGIGAFYTKTGIGTVVEHGGFAIKFRSNSKEKEIVSEKREKRIFNGEEYILERALKGDIALIKAHKADPIGNLIFRGTARNFNPDAAKAAKFTIVEVEEIVPLGSIKPEEVHLPSVFVDAIVQYNTEKKIERLTVSAGGKVDLTLTKKKSWARTGNETQTDKKIPAEDQRQCIVRRAALELKDGMNVNLGIGMPTLASNVSGISICHLA